MTALMARATPQLAERASAMGRTLLNPWYLVALAIVLVPTGAKARSAAEDRAPVF